jgi:eukaryotic-like serine/threonine-protein kinase
MEVGDLIQERYELRSRLGSGGMAEVWAAHDSRLERSVAIKFLSPRFFEDPESLVRFFSEAQSVAKISHRHVVSVLDFGEDDGTPYLVMEHVPGGSLADLDGEKVLPERALEIVAQAALGAGAAHARGIIHRDIKPGNILLTETHDVKLADFGIAASAGGEKLTATGIAIGSPHYISPEQASGAAARPESDVYSLGVVLYELLTGQPPFEGENPTALAIAHVEQIPEPPSTHVPDLDADIDALVMRCLDKEPTHRFPDGRALAHAIEGGDFLAGPLAFAEEDEPEKSRAGLLTALVAIFSIILLGGAWLVSADMDDDFQQAQRDVAQEQRRDRKPSPSPSATEAVVVAPTTSPSPSPTPSPSKKDERNPKPAGSQDPGDEVEPEPSPTPEPSPEPTPSPEPSPEPSPPGEQSGPSAGSAPDVPST